jgi:hypothetical protein
MHIFNFTIPVWALGLFALLSAIGITFALIQQRAGNRVRLHPTSRLARVAQNADNTFQIGIAIWFALLTVRYGATIPWIEPLYWLSVPAMMLGFAIWAALRTACRLQHGIWDLWWYTWDDEKPTPVVDLPDKP